MTRRPLLALAPAVLLLACPDRPALDTPDSTASSTGESTDATPSTAGPTTDTPTGTTTPTTSSTSPTDTTDTTDATDTTATASTATSPTDATTTTDATTAGLTATDTGSSTTGDPPPAKECPPCDQLIALDGPIEIDPITDLSQFGCLGTVSGHITISGDLSAEQLAPLCHLHTVTGSLDIRENAVLTDLTPFAAVESVGFLQLWELPALTAVAGMTGLKDASHSLIYKTGAKTLGSFAPDFKGIEYLRIESNAALADLSALAAWGLIGNIPTIDIRDSAALTDLSSLAELFAAAGSSFRFNLQNAPALTSLAGLEAASKGHYQLAELPLITDLQPLSTVTTLGSLRLRDIPLKNLAGLGSLQLAGLGLEAMPLLTSLDGLGPLTSGEVELIHLPKLTSLQGLESWTTGSLLLIDLPLVPSLAPLGAYTGGPWIQIYGLPLVPSLTGLDKLQSAQTLMIGDCLDGGTQGMASLTSLKGLGSLTTVGELLITNSPKLTSLAGPDKLGAVTERLAIVNTPKLPQAAFDAFVAQVVEPEMSCFGDWGICDCTGPGAPP